MSRAIAVLVVALVAAVGLPLSAGSAAADPTFAISGQILDASSTPVNGQTVELVHNTFTILVTTSGGTGDYSFDGVEPGDYSVVVLAGNAYARSSASVTVSAADVTNLDLTVTAPSTLSGHVLNAASLPVGSIDVEADFWDSVTEDWIDGTPLPINSDGSYGVAAVEGTGPYRILFIVDDDSLPFLSTYYGQLFFIRNGVDTTEPGIVNVTAPVAVTGLDVTVTPAGYISGRVTSKGVPVPGQHVIVLDPLLLDGTGFESQPPPEPPDGSYTVKVPADTALYVAAEADSGGYYIQIYNGQYLFGTNLQVVTVGPGATVSNIDFSLFPTDSSILFDLNVQQVDPSSMLDVPVDGGNLTLHVVGAGAAVLEVSQSQVLTGQAEMLADTPGEYDFVVTNDAGTPLAIESYTVDGSGVVVPVNSCTIDYGLLDEGDLTSENGQTVTIDITLAADQSSCGTTTTTPPTHHHSTTVAGSSVVSAVSAPTPTPTPTATATPSASPAPSPSASSTPAPLVTSSTGGLPWWVWLLIVVGILILAGIGFALFRRR